MLLALLRPYVYRFSRVLHLDLVWLLPLALVVQRLLMTSSSIAIPWDDAQPTTVRDGAWHWEDEYPKNLTSWIEVFFAGLSERVRNMHAFVQMIKTPDSEQRDWQPKEIYEDFVSITNVILTLLGVEFLAMIPLLSLAWGYLDQPVPQQQLNHALAHFTFLTAPIEKLTRPLVRLVLYLTTSVGLAGDADQALLLRNDAIGCTQRFLVGLLLLIMCLGVAVVIMVSSVTFLLENALNVLSARLAAV